MIGDIDAIKKKNRRLGMLLGILVLVVIAGVALPTKYEVHAAIPEQVITVEYIPYLENMGPLAQKPYLLLEFFTTDCGFCKASVSELNVLNEHAKIGVVAYTYESKSKVNAFIKEQQARYAISRASAKFRNQFAHQGVPLSYLVDTASHKVIAGFVGKVKAKEVLDAIE
jgi:hypothetical protein